MQVEIVGGVHAGQTGIVISDDGQWARVQLEGGAEDVVRQEHLQPAAYEDLKPRGIKRQWHLMPLDALALGLDACPIENLVRCLEEYQREPGASSAAHCFQGFLYRLEKFCAIGKELEPENCEGAALDIVVAVFEHGAEKYSVDNWKKAASDMHAFRQEYLSAMCRHAFPKDDSLVDQDDPETGVRGSGFPHAAHGCCTALMILWHEMRHDS